MSKKFNISCFLLIFSLIASNSSASSQIFASNHSNILVFDERESGAQFSSDIAVGDFNGDGIEDIAISSPYASSGLMEWNGKITVYFGSKDANSNANLNIYGTNSADLSGMSLSVGDLNNDGIDDLIIGSYNANLNGEKIGKVSIVFGRKIFDKSVINLNDESVYNVYGEESGSNFGISTLVYDINSDGIMDLIVGAPNASIPNSDYQGKVYIYLGEDENNLAFKLSAILNGHSKNGKFGSNIIAGDLNGDLSNELIISAHREDFENKKECGAVYIYNMNGLYQENWDLVSSIAGSLDYEWFGFQNIVSDINNDGFIDLISSSFPFASNQRKGKLSVFYGEKDMFEKDEIEVSRVFEKEIASNLLGASLIAEDIFSSGNKAIISGAPGISYPESDDSGVVFLWNEEESPIVFYGEMPDDWFGYRIKVLDFNDDGIKDIIVGAKYADSEKMINNGKAYLFFGSENGFKSKILNLNDTDKTEKFIKRGEMIALIIDEFQIKNQKREYIENCLNYRDFCFFDFITRSKFDEISLSPELILYPDNPPNYKYYEEINIATMLGIVNGFVDEPNSPFMPESEISRIQALKVLLGASELVDFKYKFELESLFGSFEAIFKQSSYFKDINTAIHYMWWYPRYVNFAYEKGLVEKNENFRPDDFITFSELSDMIDNTKKYLTNLNATTQTEL